MYYKFVFDSKIERVAVNWNNDKDGSQHVGWMDKSGNVTDVTNIVHPATSDFSSVLPKDSYSLFTTDDKLVFYDGNEDLYCYFDPETNSIVDKYDIKSDPNYEFHVFYGLDSENHPTWGSYVNFGGITYSINEGTQDFVKYDDGYVLFHMSNSSGEDNSGTNRRIYVSGVGVSDLKEPESYESIDSPYYPADGEYITPESAYSIENMVYSNENIFFTAIKGTERSLFKMSYVNRVAGEPEKITEIDSSWGDVLM